MKGFNFSQAFAKDEDSVKFLNDGTVKSKLATAKRLSEVNEKDYVAIFYVGGLGPVLDLASDTTNAKLASQVTTTKCMHFTVNMISTSSSIKRGKSRLLCAMDLRTTFSTCFRVFIDSRDLGHLLRLWTVPVNRYLLGNFSLASPMQRKK